MHAYALNVVAMDGPLCAYMEIIALSGHGCTKDSLCKDAVPHACSFVMPEGRLARGHVYSKLDRIPRVLSWKLNYFNEIWWMKHNPF